ncbi:hypothetical protein C8Q76DRAFT_751391 [Earliella scabrosa]|nr:hypothetical protein C8Q76DRAFT_751391 [Earliella scabrosa]
MDSFPATYFRLSNPLHLCRPERWENPPEAISNIPGVWGHLLTFLGGPRACIGYHFSLTQMKAIIYTLVRAFEFELAVPAEDSQKKSSIVQRRPVLRSQPESGSQMPAHVDPQFGPCFSCEPI